MKKCTSLLAGLLVAALSLLGCVGVLDEASGSVEIAGEVEAVGEAEGTGEAEVAEDAAALSESFVATDVDAGLLLYAGDALSDMEYPEFVLVDGGVLVYEGFYSEEFEWGERLVLLDVADDTSAATEFACEFLTDIRQTDEGIMFADSGLGLVVLLDDELQVAQTWEVEGNYEFWYVSTDGQSVFIIDEGALTRVYLADIAEDEEAAETEAAEADEVEAEDSEADAGGASELFLLVEETEELDESNVVLSSSVSLYGTAASNGGVNISYVDEDSQLSLEAWLDLATGEVSVLDVDEAVFSVSKAGDTWLAMLGYTSSAGYLVGTADDLYYVELEDGDLTQVQGCDYLLWSSTEYTYETDDEGDEVAVDALTTFTLYDADGAFVASIELAGLDVWYYGNCCAYSETYGGFFLMIYRDEGPQLYFWDVDISEEEEPDDAAEDAADDEPDEAADDTASDAADDAPSDLVDDVASDTVSDLALPLVPLAEYEQTPGGTAVDAELYERAAALSEEYGITILIADQCATEYTDFTVEQVLDADLIAAALDTLAEALSAYPDGFLDQLKYDKVTRIQINLCGTLTSTSDNWGDENYNGFTEESGSTYLMVLDLNQLWTDTIYHEISHIIDQKLEWDAYCRDDALFSEETWASLNPEGFEYVYVYSGFDELVFEGDEYLYFIDTYSMVSPTEDRARIMEFAMAGYDWYFTDYEPTYAKLRYYAACIRDAFDTTGWPETTAWEDVG